MSDEVTTVVDPFTGDILCGCGQVHSSPESVLTCTHPTRRPPVVPGWPACTCPDDAGAHLGGCPRLAAIVGSLPEWQGRAAERADPYETAVIHFGQRPVEPVAAPAPRSWWLIALTGLAVFLAALVVVAGGWAIGTATGPWGLAGGGMMIAGAGSVLYVLLGARR
jgi:hypothetical protein